MQSRKDKISSKDITENFLFSLFDSSIMKQIVYSKFIMFLIAFDWSSPILITNAFCIWFLRGSSINFEV